MNFQAYENRGQTGTRTPTSLPALTGTQESHWNEFARKGEAATSPRPELNKINRGLTPYPHGPDCQPSSASSLVSTNGDTSTGMQNIIDR